MYVRIIGNDSLYPDQCPWWSPPCDYSSRWDTITCGTRFRSKRTLYSNQPIPPSARDGVLYLGARGGSRATSCIPTCLCACISACLFGLPRVLGTEGLSVTRGKTCVVSVRRRWPGCCERESRIPSWPAVESRLSYIQPGLDYRLPESSSS